MRVACANKAHQGTKYIANMTKLAIETKRRKSEEHRNGSFYL